MSEYVKNGLAFGWGPGVVSLNPEKTSLLEKYASGKCLDVGHGSGIYTNFLNSLGYDSVGVDNEKEFVTKASKTYPDVKYVHSEATVLPFKKNEFDTVVLFDIIEHLDDEKMLKEASRVGKRLIISVPHSNQEQLTEYSLVHSHYLDRTHLRTYTPESLKSVLKKSKLKVIMCKPSLPISLSGLLIQRLSRGNRIKQFLLKLLLKPFLPEPPIYSTVFAVAETE